MLSFDKFRAPGRCAVGDTYFRRAATVQVAGAADCNLVRNDLRARASGRRATRKSNTLRWEVECSVKIRRCPATQSIIAVGYGSVAKKQNTGIRTAGWRCECCRRAAADRGVCSFQVEGYAGARGVRAALDREIAIDNVGPRRERGRSVHGNAAVMTWAHRTAAGKRRASTRGRWRRHRSVGIGSCGGVDLWRRAIMFRQARCGVDVSYRNKARRIDRGASAHVDSAVGCRIRYDITSRRVDTARSTDVDSLIGGGIQRENARRASR